MSSIKERKDALLQYGQAMKLQPECPVCGTKQVQLLNWYTQPVLYKCRHCKKEFHREVV